MARLGQHLAQAPAVDAVAIAESVWIDQRTAVVAVLQNGETFRSKRQILAGIVEEDAWKTDVTVIRKQIAGRGKAWFRWLSRGYREAIRALERVCVNPPPRDLKDRLAILDDLLAGQNARSAIQQDEATARVGRRAFGSNWKALQSDWQQLRVIEHWVQEGEARKLPSSFRQLLGSVSNASQCSRLVKKISDDFKPVLAELKALFQDLDLDLKEAFENSDLNSISLAAIQERLTQWGVEHQSLETWIGYRTRWNRLENEQLGELARLIASGCVPKEAAQDQFYSATYEAIMRSIYEAYPSLKGFDGRSHEEIVKRFRELDRQRAEFAAREVELAHFQRIPRSDAAIGEMSILRHEMQKKSRHLPIRKLIGKAGRTIQAIKPVFMMSPLSVAQFLEPGAVEFDLLLIDEASQVRPADAVGAIGRCKQIVVVGDDKQLPPTSFFDKLVSNVDEDDEEDDASITANIESVLGLCSRRFNPRMLRWHYRSRHHSLIAVSNHEFYDDKLLIIPSPHGVTEELGLHFRHVVDGVFDRGQKRDNRIEALAIAKACVEHVRKWPNLSLGVGAFSVAQRDAIEAELERLRGHNPDVDCLLSSAPNGERFFVKNLESLQGDERDVIFISIGYAKDASGYPSMNFGPLSKQGGERRLNVLISRARERCEVFSSMTADDIKLDQATSRGAAVLKTFLKYAQTGILDVGIPTGRECDSDFELEVKRRLEQNGFEVESQIGVAGFFVDLAVRDPNRPGRYLLGIECDGATYHSSRSARDRDRLRQQVLEDRQWIIHRIWSTDWFKNSDVQLQRTLDAIENARVVTRGGSTPDSFTGDAKDAGANDELDEDDCEPVDSSDPLLQIVTPYEEAELRARTDQPLHEVPVAGLAQIAMHVVQVESPIHGAEVARRIASFWGHQRVSARMFAAVRVALNHAVRQGGLTTRGDFYLLSGQQDIPIRNREDVISATLRNAEMLPPDEIRKAVLQIVQMHVGAGNSEIVAVASRLFGFRSTGSKLRQAIAQVVDELLADGSLAEREHRLYAC